MRVRRAELMFRLHGRIELMNVFLLLDNMFDHAWRLQSYAMIIGFQSWLLSSAVDCTLII